MKMYLGLIVALTIAATCANAAPMYTIQDLNVKGWSWGYANGINEYGQVTLWSSGGNFVYQNGVRTGVGEVIPYGINEKGYVAGYQGVTGGYNRAVVWNNNATTTLNSLGGQPRDDYGQAINDSGQVAGYSKVPSGVYHACVWTNGVPRDLGTTLSGSSFAYGINNSNQAVGIGTTPITSIYGGAIRWDNGIPIVLSSSGLAFDINDAGNSVGYALNNGRWEAYLWRGTTAVNIGVLPGWRQGYARAINASDQVVGYCDSTINFKYRAFMWQNGSLYDLNDLLPSGSGWEITEAMDINDTGQIVGYGYYGGIQHAFLMTPVPEPSSILTMLFGIAGTVKLLQRKRR